MSSAATFELDGHSIPFSRGDTVMDAALRAGHYIPLPSPRLHCTWQLPAVHRQYQRTYGLGLHCTGSGRAKDTK